MSLLSSNFLSRSIHHIPMESDPETDDDFKASESRKLVASMNRKKKKAGGFQAMGLSHTVFKGLMKKGYKIPTPIQRKTIPLILSGRDVVAMARTGSGKTAAFLLPVFEKLQTHVATGPRALIISPTRELALQTLKFTKELGKFTGLTAAVILGGDKMDEQFAALHAGPDIIVATPGRLLHVVMEMNFNLKTIQYVVFDEGDRMFELGFAEQLSETLNRLPRDRQTLIFSATLPSNLIEFARAGLCDPILVRLDVDSKLSKNLSLVHISCLPDQKNSVLLHLLKCVIPVKQQVVVFFATKHHVEFYQMLLTDAGINCSSIHSGLDPMARNAAIKSFSTGQVRLLLVTDVAARGVDIPLLDNVINYHFPPQPKLFLHRVGRIARAGRSGTAYSLIDPDELPHLFDVFVFLGKSLQFTSPGEGQSTNDFLGRPPRTLTSSVGNLVQQLVSRNANLGSMAKVCTNAMKRYIQTRPKASSESVRRAKEIRTSFPTLQVHPVFPEKEDEAGSKVLDVIRGLQLPTIFEALGRHANPEAYDMMAKKRKLHESLIAKHAKRLAQSKVREENMPEIIKRTANLTAPVGPPSAVDVDEENLEHTDLFVPYFRGNEAQERGLSIGTPSNQFAVQATDASLNLIGDEHSQTIRPIGSKLRKTVWDRRRKRYVDSEAAEGKANLKRIKTESGVWIPASYKTDKYAQWLKRSQFDRMAAETAANSEQIDQTSGTTTTFSARFGGVVEFPDELKEVGRMSKKRQKGGSKSKRNVDKQRNSDNEDNKTKEKRAAKSFGTSKGIQVLGTQPWFKRAEARQRQKAQNAAEAQKIRQPKGSRTFGQLRRPEQVLKQRRLRAKQLMKKKQKGHKGGKPSGKHGPTPMSRKPAFKRRK